MRVHQVLAGDAEGWEIGESGNQERGQGGPVAEDSMLSMQGPSFYPWSENDPACHT